MRLHPVGILAGCILAACLGACRTENGRKGGAVEPDAKKVFFRTIRETAQDAVWERVVKMYGPDLAKRRHPGGWDIWERTADGPWREVSISPNTDDPRRYTDVILSVSPALGAVRADILAEFGMVFSKSPMAPDNFTDHTIVYSPEPKTQLFFTCGEGEILKRVIVRKF